MNNATLHTLFNVVGRATCTAPLHVLRQAPRGRCCVQTRAAPQGDRNIACVRVIGAADAAQRGAQRCGHAPRAR